MKVQGQIMHEAKRLIGRSIIYQAVMVFLESNTGLAEMSFHQIQLQIDVGYSIQIQYYQMEPEDNPSEQKGLKLSPSKKRVKNNKWIPQEKQNQSINQHQSFQSPSQYPNINELHLKYNFDTNSVIGMGAGGTVYLGSQVNSNKMVCVKAVDLLLMSNQGTNALELLKQEIESMNLFKNSEYIVNFYDIYESPTFYYIVMELCPGGDVFKMLQFSKFQLPLEFINSIILQICKGLKQIHENGMIHRDLKTENILIVKFPQTKQEQIKVKIGDLGFCIAKKTIKQAQENGKTLLNMGSPIYMCPQISLNHKYSEYSDIYALGVIWYQLMHKIAPWKANTESQLLDKKLTTSEVKFWREDMPEDMKKLMNQILDVKPGNRPGLTQIIDYLQSLKSVEKKESINENKNDN